MKRIVAIVIALILCLMLFVACEQPDEPNNQPDEQPIYWGKVTGVVTSNDKPLAGVTVKSASRTVTTDENGAYTIEVYNDGATISFEKDGCITQKKTFRSSDFYRDEIQYDFIMFVSTKVFGFVKDATDNAIADATVCIGDQSTTTDADGYYQFDSVIATSMVIIVTKGDTTARGAVFADDMQDGECEVDDIILK